MSAVSASMVKELRERTGLGMMDCKKALEETGGDMAAAETSLRKSSGLKAAKKAGRIASDGLLGGRVEGDRGVIVEVNCETDFTSRNRNFVAFVQAVTDRVFETGDPAAPGLESERQALVQKIGEHITIRRAEVFRDEGAIAGYLHTNNRVGALLSMRGGDEALGRDLAMHIVAMHPLVVSPQDVPAELLATEREIYTAQARDSGKPPAIVEKMVAGKVGKYLSDISLLEQAFVKDGSIRVGDLLQKAGASVNRFVRFEVGEGIDKVADDFAEEVRKQLGG